MFDVIPDVIPLEPVTGEAGEEAFQVTIVCEGGETTIGTRKADEPSGENEE